MSLSKYSKQLQKELKANRKKAAMLAVLAVAAVWFWLPLVMPKASSAPAAAVVPATVPLATQAAAAVPPTKSEPTLRWQDLDKWITDDAETKPFVLAEAEHRDPFVRVQKPPTAKELADAEARKQQELVTIAKQRPTLTPQKAGLELNSTMVGRVSKASISGKTYEVGEDVEGFGGAGFKLVDIKQSHVVLSRQGAEFKLEIRRSVAVSSRDTTIPPSQ